MPLTAAPVHSHARRGPRLSRVLPLGEGCTADAGLALPTALACAVHVHFQGVRSLCAT